MNYDIIIFSAKKDLHKIKYIYDGIINNLTGYNKIYCICPEFPTELVNGVEYVLDTTVGNFDMSGVKFRPDWIRQQYMKLFQDITLDLYLVIDADIIINKPIEIFTNNKPNFLLGGGMKYNSFTNYCKLLFDFSGVYEKSFVNEIMLFDRRIVNEMISSKFKTQEDFIIESNKIINPTCLISEYELYGNYIYSSHRDSYNYKMTSTLRFNKFSKWLPADIEAYIIKYVDSNYSLLTIPSI